MISPVSIATRGRITSSASRTLTLAVIGWLVISSTPPNSPSSGGGSGSGGAAAMILKTPLDLERDEELRIIKTDEENLINIIKIFLECQ